MQFEMAIAGLFVRITRDPMANGGAVVTFEDVTEKRQNEERIVFMAGHDALTGLPNRTMFQEHTEAAVTRLGRASISPCCASISTISRTSMIRSAMPRVTSCCGWSRGVCATACATLT